MDITLKQYDKIDIYIQPSDQEGLPRSLIEAMSRACPAVGSTTAGIPELLDSEFVFKRKKHLKLYDILDRFNKVFMLEQASRNHRVSKKYVEERIYLRRERFYQYLKEPKTSSKNGSDYN